MNRAFLGNRGNLLPCTVVHVADDFDFRFDAVDLAVLGFTIHAIVGMNFIVPEDDDGVLQRNAFALGIHPHGHGFAGPQGR